ncbi:MAG: class I SAM-dependent methyltransferase [Acidimicrobiales bacterium]
MSAADAYSATGAAWQTGPARIYDRLADVLVAASPVDLAGALVVDVGAGTGAASRAITRAGGRAVALDLADGMLRVDQPQRPPAVVADARRLPLASGSCAAVVAAFSYNHVPDPEVALADAARVLAPGGVVLASAYAEDDAHPVKAAVEAAVADEGWSPAWWIDELKANAMPVLATTERASAVAASAGLDATAQAIAVPLPDLSPADLVAWRMGMAQVAPFIASLSKPARRRVEARALDLLGPHPEPLVRRMIILTARRL